jgi:hypothetical protein
LIGIYFIFFGETIQSSPASLTRIMMNSIPAVANKPQMHKKKAGKKFCTTSLAGSGKKIKKCPDVKD